MLELSAVVSREVRQMGRLLLVYGGDQELAGHALGLIGGRGRGGRVVLVLPQEMSVSGGRGEGGECLPSDPVVGPV